ncbi:hypothetical protein ACJMK2_042806 [Sinanodonta woodiana]|uniref:THAP-type domain-containing protein n=1 Tax=Sinanodonta woodiana TaxID=1069815 RepID=A0ABD3VUZ9_SINWO
MPICGILGCFTHHGVRKDLRFFKTPKIIKDQGEETLKLSEERRRLWKAAWERTIVCSQHFVGGVKAYLHDRTSPAWLPSLHLGKPETSSPVPNVHLANDRFIRSTFSLRSLKKRHIDYSKSVTEEHSASHDILAQCDAGSSESALQLPTEYESHSKGIQTDLTIKEIQQLVDDNKARLIKALENEKFNIKGLYSFNYYENINKNVGFYTSMPEFELLKLVFNFIEGHMNSNIKSLSRENEFLLCMLKLRMDYLFKDMAHQLDVLVATQRSGENIPTIDKIVKVACCLTNLCPSVVLFD